MKKRVIHTVVKMGLFITISFYCPQLFSQVKVGNNPTTINPNSVLEIESTNKGLLLPRLALSATTNVAPLTAFVQGMFVFNTATAGDVTPGIYYCDGTKWVKVSPVTPSGGPLPSTSWNLVGNTSTLATDFLGTGDYAPLVIKTNNLERLRVTQDGWIGIGTATPVAALQIKGQLVIDSLTAGNTATDSFLVANPADGRVKMVSAASFSSGQKKNITVVGTSGQTVFTTPAAITDINKISLYRNGVLISCAVNNATSVIAEVPCVAGDEIRIIQLL
jgi:hypothetical protein